MFALYGRNGEKLQIEQPLHPRLPPGEAAWPQPYLLRRTQTAPRGVRMDEGDVFTSRPTLSNHDATLGMASGLTCRHGVGHREFGGFYEHRRRPQTGASSSQGGWGEHSSVWDEPPSPAESARSRSQ